MNYCFRATIFGFLWLTCSLSLAAAPAGASPASAPSQAPRWRIVASHYPTNDVVVAGCTVGEFGARGDGATDDTAAFQAAMNMMASNGGGTVFAPEGRYALRGNLIVPATVTLRGEREEPAPGSPVRGTILMAYAGRGKAEGKPLLSLKMDAGVKDLIIWHPEQDAAHITPYPFAIQYSEVGTIEGVTLVNAYQGINDPVGSTYMIRNVCGSPLFTGIQIDGCYDTGRIENLHFSPDFWSNSGLPGAPTPNGLHAAWMLAGGTAMRLLRIDWQCAYFVQIEGYQTGIEMLSGKHGTPYGEFYESKVVHCVHAISDVESRFPGFLFTRCLLEGTDSAVVTSDQFDAFLGFHSCTIRGKNKAVDIRGKQSLAALFHRCTLDGEVSQAAGSLSLLGCTFAKPASSITLGPSLRAATIAGQSMMERRRLFAAALPSAFRSATSPCRSRSCRRFRRSSIACSSRRERPFTL